MPNRALFSGPPGGRGDRSPGSAGRSAPPHCACEIKQARGRPERHLTGMSHFDMPTYNGAQSPPAIQSAVACDKAD
jgi:hypothetical protein